MPGIAALRRDRFVEMSSARYGAAQMLIVEAGAWAAMLDHALRCEPEEACGFLAGRPGEDSVVRFFAIRNAAASATCFTIDGQEMLDTERAMDGLGLEIKGVMHSHPKTEAWPSPTDVADSARFDPLGVWRSVIVSLRRDEPDVGCFRITDGAIAAEDIVSR